MKRLIICRHAKSSWDDPFLTDHKRPLAERGLRDAPKMAHRLKKKNILPDDILSSDAERAKSTALITAEILKYPKENIVFTNQLYHSSSNSILKKIRNTKDVVSTLFIFGHNPGLNDLIELLGGEIDNLPTCGQYGFIFSTDSWKGIGPKNGKTFLYDFPKKESD